MVPLDEKGIKGILIIDAAERYMRDGRKVLEGATMFQDSMQFAIRSCFECTVFEIFPGLDRSGKGPFCRPRLSVASSPAKVIIKPRVLAPEVV